MRSARLPWPFETMAADSSSVTEQWIRGQLSLQHSCLADVRSLSLPGSYETGKIGHLGISLKNFVRLKSLDLSHNLLDSVQGLIHLKLLEKLNLYYNRISSLEDVLALRRLQNLKELDLRLNPVVQKHPHYRLYLVHAIAKLRKLDDCAVRDRERKAALMHFSVESALEPGRRERLIAEEKRDRSSDPRIASVNKMIMTKLSLREGNEEAALKHRFNTDGAVEAQAGAPLPLAEKNLPESQAQSTVRRRPSLKTSDAPRVTFVDHSVIRHSPEHLWPEPVTNPSVPSRIQAESNFTPHPSTKRAVLRGGDQRAPVVKDFPEGERNPVLHPPRVTYRNSDDAGRSRRPSLKPEGVGRPCKGAYKKPMELLLSLVEEYWSGRKKNHNTKHFFMHAVRILCMMEQEVVSGEEEMNSLRERIQIMNSQVELQDRRHQSEIQSLSEQLQRANGSIQHLDEQLRSVLEENVSLQKQLIRLEQKLLSEQLREMSSSADGGE
ncbi:centrosomal protein of 72 kDa [Salminus brasiliensis]|uniref:centrosomal protein of 72 kDa n=1 Tax=Salminus brasiliensis TaxID=930266 RepID=UPI003B836842